MVTRTLGYWTESIKDIGLVIKRTPLIKALIAQVQQNLITLYSVINNMLNILIKLWLYCAAIVKP